MGEFSLIDSCETRVRPEVGEHSKRWPFAAFCALAYVNEWAVFPVTNQ